MSLKLVPFESLGAVFYSPSIVTVAVPVAVCEIFSVKEWCDLENTVRVRSRSLENLVFRKPSSPVFVLLTLFSVMSHVSGCDLAISSVDF